MVNRERISEEFRAMAAISSPSFKEGEISRYLKERFERLGAEVVYDQAADAIGSESSNMVARLPGTSEATEPFLLLVHMDTVTPAEGVVPILEDGVFRSAGNTILGADDKAGIAEAIEALEVIKEQQIPHPPIEIVVTVCEEIGLLGAKNFDFGLINAKKGVALDTTEINVCINKAPAANRFKIEIVGREAHAGVSPEKGISAVEVAARAIAHMPLGRIDDHTTANIGLIAGGQATNIVPRGVQLDGEVRSHDEKRVGEYMDAILRCVQEACEESMKEIDGELHKARFDFEVRDDYPVMAVHEDAAILDLVREAGDALGRTVEVKGAGGGSDANIFNKYGVETVILGTGMERVHSIEEFVRVDDMVSVAELVVEIIRRV